MDTAVSFLLDNLPVYIETANSEATLPSEVEDRIESLQNEFHFMNTFLHDSRWKRKEHDLVRDVAGKIIDVAHHAEDVIDNYIVSLVRHSREFLSTMSSVGDFDYPLILDGVDEQIQEIKTTINEIYGNKDKYGIEKDTKRAAEEDPLRRQTVEVEEDETIGLDKHSKETPHNPYELQPLEQEDSWKLLCKKVFHEETCPDPLLELHGRRIVQHCKGVPLSIVISAGLLLNKRLPEQWSEIADNINRFLDQDKETHVEDILKLSYNNLPEELKPCFLYLGIYPEDYEIPVRQLIQLWIAEGFIQVKQTAAEPVPELEVVAEKYLCELIDRGLIQVATKRTDGGAKTCRIHDLVRDLCVSESRESKFFEIFRQGNTMSKSKPRRLSLHCGTEAYSCSNSCDDHPCTRSLFCFRHEDFSKFYDRKYLQWFLNEFKLVRVLDLGQRNSYFFGDKLDNLVCLRYFRAKTSSPTLPISDSICVLRNLVSLDTRCWRMDTLPSEIWKLKQLRHLYLGGSVILPDLTKGAADNKVMRNLQTLSAIYYHSKNLYLLVKGRFPNLKKLGLCGSDRKDRKAVEFMQMLECSTHLETLKLISVPNPHAFPKNITKITLKKVRSWEIEKYLKALANLGSLRILKLSQGDDLSSKPDLPFPAGGFQQLQVLVVKTLTHENLILGDDAIPQLRRLVIKKCTKLKGLPDELLSSETLAEVEILWPSTEMAGMVKNLEKDNIKLKVYPPLDGESSF